MYCPDACCFRVPQAALLADPNGFSFQNHSAGVVIVIIREDLITEDTLPGTPTMLKYKIHADNASLYNTPPAYGIYISFSLIGRSEQSGIYENVWSADEATAFAVP